MQAFGRDLQIGGYAVQRRHLQLHLTHCQQEAALRPIVLHGAQRAVQRHGLREVFGCARMYYGRPPALSHDEIYGVTTFELG